MKRAKATGNGGWVKMLQKRISKYSSKIKEGNLFDQLIGTLLSEGKGYAGPRVPYIIYVLYKSDGNRVRKDRVKAYSERQAIAYFLKVNPEYRNERLFEVTAESDRPPPGSGLYWD